MGDIRRRVIEGSGLPPDVDHKGNSVDVVYSYFDRDTDDPDSRDHFTYTENFPLLNDRQRMAFDEARRNDRDKAAMSRTLERIGTRVDTVSIRRVQGPEDTERVQEIQFIRDGGGWGLRERGIIDMQRDGKERPSELYGEGYNISHPQPIIGPELVSWTQDLMSGLPARSANSRQ